MLKLCLILTLALIQTNAFDFDPPTPCNYDDDCSDEQVDDMIISQYCVVNQFSTIKLAYKG